MKRIIKNIIGCLKANKGKTLFAIFLIACVSEIIIAPAAYYSALKREEAKRAEVETMRGRA